MSERPPRPPPHASPAALRSWSVEHELTPFLAEVFARLPSVRSVYCCVAQYWADEADDAVHDLFVFSEKDTPDWPHVCQDDVAPGVPAAMLLRRADLCTSCAWELSELETDEVTHVTENPKTREVVTHYRSVRCDWDDNGAAVRPWQAFCVEGAQDLDVAGNYQPVLLARRTAASFSLRVVGGLMRPWLDLPSTAAPSWASEAARGAEPVPRPTQPAAWAPFLAAIRARPLDDGPRRVFADWLQQQGHPAGELLAQSLLAPESEELEAQRSLRWLHLGELWLGPLAGVLSPAAVDFGRGLARGAVLHWEPSRATDPFADEAWRTLEWLHYTPESEAVWGRTLVSLSEVSGLRRRADVERFLALPGLRHLGVALNDAPVLEPLLTPTPAQLRSVGLWLPRGSQWERRLGGAVEALRRARSPHLIQALEVWAPPSAQDALPRVLAILQRDWPELKRRTVGTWEPTSELPAGPRLDDVRGDAKPSFLADFTRHRLPPPAFDPEEDPPPG